MKHKWKYLSTGILIILILIFCTGCGDDRSNEISSGLNVTVLSLKEYYPLAYELAHEWDEEAVPVTVRLVLVSQYTSWQNSFLEIRFESPKILREYFFVWCSFEGCESYSSDTNFSYLDAISYYQIERLELDSIDAAEIGLLRGGREILGFPGSYGAVSLTKKNDKTYWYAVYSNELESFHIYIDPTTGEVLDLETGE